jgi:hypothetical protein
MRTLDVPGVTLAVGNATWAALGTVFKTGIVYKGDQVASGYDMIPNGVYVPSTCTMTAVKITLDFPTIGGTQAWNVVLDHAGTKSTVATVTIADGARGAVTNSLSVSLVAGDLLLFQCSAANGATFTGSGSDGAVRHRRVAVDPHRSRRERQPCRHPHPHVGRPVLDRGYGGVQLPDPPRRQAVRHHRHHFLHRPRPDRRRPVRWRVPQYNVDSLVPGAITVNTNAASTRSLASYVVLPAVSQNVGALTNDFVVTAGSNTTGASAAHVARTGSRPSPQATSVRTTRRTRCTSNG